MQPFATTTLLAMAYLCHLAERKCCVRRHVRHLLRLQGVYIAAAVLVWFV